MTFRLHVMSPWRTIPNIKEYFNYEAGDARRMIVVILVAAKPNFVHPGGGFLACRFELTEGLSAPLCAVVYGLMPDFWRCPHVDVPLA